MIRRFGDTRPGGRKGLIADEPVARLGKPEEIASAVLWLCSDDAAFTTGTRARRRRRPDRLTTPPRSRSRAHEPHLRLHRPGRLHCVIRTGRSWMRTTRARHENAVRRLRSAGRRRAEGLHGAVDGGGDLVFVGDVADQGESLVAGVGGRGHDSGVVVGNIEAHA